jgi:hypothetical protein
VAPQSEAQRLAYAALIHAQLGDAASSHEAIVASIRKAVGSPIEHTIRKLDQSLRSTVTDDFQGHARLK